MKVIHVVEAAEGGVARHLHDLATGMAALGVPQLILYAPGRADPIFHAFREALTPRVSFREVSMVRGLGVHDVRDGLALGAVLRGAITSDTIVHAHSSKAGALVRLVVPRRHSGQVVYTPHAFITMAPGLPAIRRLFYRTIERILSYRCAAVVTVSPQEAAHAVELGLSPDVVAMIPHGIQPLSASEREAGAAMRAALRVPPSARLVAFVGRFAPQKAPHLVLKAFGQIAAELPDHHLVLAGDGELDQSLKDLVAHAEYRDRIHFPGRIEGRIAFAGSDVAVQPSRYESFGYVFLEALAAGIPVVSTATGIAPEVAKHTRMYHIVPQDDATAIALALRDLARHTDSPLSPSASIPEGYTVASMVSTTIALYRRLLEVRAR